MVGYEPPRAIWRSPVSMETAMTYSFWRSERMFLTDPRDGRLVRNTNTRNADTWNRNWDRIIGILANRDLIAVVMVCVIGLLATFALFLLVPSSRELTISVQQMF